MKLAILYTGRSGGLNYYTYNLAKALNQIAPIEIILSSENDLLENYGKIGCKVNIFETYNNKIGFLINTFVLFKYRKIFNFINKSDFTDVIDTGSIVWGELIRRKLKFVRKSLIIHDTNIYKEKTSIILNKINLYDPFNPAADIIFLLSEFNKKQYLLNIKERNKNINVTHVGPLHDRCSDMETKSSYKNFLFLGRIEPYKNIELLIDAYISAKNFDTSIKLTIMGSGSISKDYISKAVKNGVNIINRWISENEILSALSWAGTIVLPYREGPASGLIAAAYENSCAIIATNIGAFPEYIKDGVNGLLVECNEAAIANAILSISSDKNFYNYLIDNVNSNKNLSWLEIANNLLNNLRNSEYN